MDQNKHLIVLVGLPGSGKSTLAKGYADYVRINQDEQGKDGHKVKFNDALSSGKNIIIDRCGFNVEQRQRYIMPAKQAKYRTTIIWLTTAAEECIKRIKNREDHPNLKNTNTNIEDVVMMFDKMFVAPENWEAAEVISV